MVKLTISSNIYTVLFSLDTTHTFLFTVYLLFSLFTRISVSTLPFYSVYLCDFGLIACGSLGFTETMNYTLFLLFPLYTNCLNLVFRNTICLFILMKGGGNFCNGSQFIA